MKRLWALILLPALSGCYAYPGVPVGLRPVVAYDPCYGYGGNLSSPACQAQSTAQMDADNRALAIASAPRPGVCNSLS